MIQGKKRKYYIIEDRVKINGRYITKNIRYLGTAEKILENLQELDPLRGTIPKVSDSTLITTAQKTGVFSGLRCDSRIS